MRVLSALRWPASVRDGDVLPSVEYPSFDEQPIVEAVRDVRRSIYPGELIDDWLESTAGAIELTARLLAARGNRGVPRLPPGPLRHAAHAAAVRPGDALRAGRAGP
jgi:hypothetical protein